MSCAKYMSSVKSVSSVKAMYSVKTLCCFKTMSIESMPSIYSSSFKSMTFKAMPFDSTLESMTSISIVPKAMPSLFTMEVKVMNGLMSNIWVNDVRLVNDNRWSMIHCWW